MSAPRISVIVAAHNAENAMPKLLDRLRAQTLPPEEFEVFIVDDSSTDGTAAVVEASDVARLLRTPRNSGAYVARNIGLREASAPVIAITDADCEPEPQWLEEALTDLDRLGADMLGGHIEVPLRERPTIAELVDVARYLDQERSVEQADVAMTANFVARREVFDRLGPFNERLISNGDVEYSLRAREAGFRLAYSARAAVLHHPRTRGRDLASKCYRMGKGTSQIIDHGIGPGRNRPRIFLRPGAYLMRRGVWGMERVLAMGYRPTRGELLRMDLGEYFWVQLPMVAGSFVEAVRDRLGRLRRALQSPRSRRRS